MLCSRLSWLLVRFGAHVNIFVLYCIISHHSGDRGDNGADGGIDVGGNADAAAAADVIDSQC